MLLLLLLHLQYLTYLLQLYTTLALDKWMSKANVFEYNTAVLWAAWRSVVLLSAVWFWPIVLDVEVHGFDELDAVFSEQGNHGNAAYLVVGN